jgi:predicted enzyme related to lactoylglutathione lyase
VTGIVWWEIETSEPEAFQRFHADLFGWSFAPAFADTDLGADYWIIQTDGRGIGGLQRADAGAPSPSAGVRMYLETDDLEATLLRVEGRGGTVERGRTALGGDDRWFAVFRDPVGVSFGLWTAEPAAQDSTT